MTFSATLRTAKTLPLPGTALNLTLKVLCSFQGSWGYSTLDTITGYEYWSDHVQTYLRPFIAVSIHPSWVDYSRGKVPSSLGQLSLCRQGTLLPQQSW